MLARNTRDYKSADLNFMTHAQLQDVCLRLESRNDMMEILLGELHNEGSKLQWHKAMLKDRINRIEASLVEPGAEPDISSPVSIIALSPFRMEIRGSPSKSCLVPSESGTADVAPDVQQLPDQSPKRTEFEADMANCKDPQDCGNLGSNAALDVQTRLGQKLSPPEEVLVRQSADGTTIRVTWFYNEFIMEELADPCRPLQGLTFEIRQQSEGAGGRLRSRMHHCEAQYFAEGQEESEQSFEIDGCVSGKAYAFSVRARARYKGCANPLYSPYSETVILGELAVDSASNVSVSGSLDASMTVDSPENGEPGSISSSSLAPSIEDKILAANASKEVEDALSRPPRQQAKHEVQGRAYYLSSLNQEEKVLDLQNNEIAQALTERSDPITDQQEVSELKNELACDQVARSDSRKQRMSVAMEKFKLYQELAQCRMNEELRRRTEEEHRQIKAADSHQITDTQKLISQEAQSNTNQEATALLLQEDTITVPRKILKDVTGGHAAASLDPRKVDADQQRNLCKEARMVIDRGEVEMNNTHADMLIERCQNRVAQPRHTCHERPAAPEQDQEDHGRALLASPEDSKTELDRPPRACDEVIEVPELRQTPANDKRAGVALSEHCETRVHRRLHASDETFTVPQHVTEDVPRSQASFAGHFEIERNCQKAAATEQLEAKADGQAETATVEDQQEGCDKECGTQADLRRLTEQVRRRTEEIRKRSEEEILPEQIHQSPCKKLVHDTAATPRSASASVPPPVERNAVPWQTRHAFAPAELLCPAEKQPRRRDNPDVKQTHSKNSAVHQAASPSWSPVGSTDARSSAAAKSLEPADHNGTIHRDVHESDRRQVTTKKTPTTWGNASVPMPNTAMYIPTCASGTTLGRPSLQRNTSVPAWPVAPSGVSMPYAAAQQPQYGAVLPNGPSIMAGVRPASQASGMQGVPPPVVLQSAGKRRSLSPQRPVGAGRTHGSAVFTGGLPLAQTPSVPQPFIPQVQPANVFPSHLAMAAGSHCAPAAIHHLSAPNLLDLVYGNRSSTHHHVNLLDPCRPMATEMGHFGLTSMLNSAALPPPRRNPALEGCTAANQASAAGRKRMDGGPVRESARCRDYELIVLTSGSQWETLNFTALEDLNHKGGAFLQEHGLTAAFHPTLVAKMRSMVRNRQAQSSVDLIDLL